MTPVRHESLDDPAAFRALYRAHHPAVFRTAYAVVHDHLLAEDVAQDVFLALWRRPERFDPDRGDIGPYLRLMARSRALDLWRSSRTGRRAQDRLVEHVLRDERVGEDAAAALEHRERALELTAAVMRLPDAQREAVALAYWGGLPSSEVARRTSVPLGTAKSRLRLGLARLRDDVATATGAYAQPTGG